METQTHIIDERVPERRPEPAKPFHGKAGGTHGGAFSSQAQ